jgi:membrane-associated phospholipid phosphatase
MLAIAHRVAGTYGYGSGHAMIGTLLMLFFGLPSMTRSL